MVSDCQAEAGLSVCLFVCLQWGVMIMMTGIVVCEWCWCPCGGSGGAQDGEADDFMARPMMRPIDWHSVMARSPTY